MPGMSVMPPSPLQGSSHKPVAKPKSTTSSASASSKPATNTTSSSSATNTTSNKSSRSSSKSSSKSSGSGNGSGNTSASKGSGTTPTPATLKREASSAALTKDKVEKLLKKCDVRDKLIYVSRQILGGPTINGFSRATTAAQRTKKLRVTRLAKQQLQQEQDQQQGGTSTGTGNKDKSTKDKESSSSSTSTKARDKSSALTDKDIKEKEKALQRAEEASIKEAMTVKPAKKIRGDLLGGLEHCKTMHETLVAILKELDPTFVVPTLMETTSIANRKPGPISIKPLPISLSTSSKQSSRKGGLDRSDSTKTNLGSSSSSINKNNTNSSTSNTALGSSSRAGGGGGGSSSANTTAAAAGATIPSKTAISPQKKVSIASSSNNVLSAGKTTASPGDPSGSTLRKKRKHKFPPVPDSITLPEHDKSGKRNVTKKEHAWRIFELTRFRALQQGTNVAARVSSRDLWILARVMIAYPGLEMDNMEFLQLKEVRMEIWSISWLLVLCSASVHFMVVLLVATIVSLCSFFRTCSFSCL